jgi:asparagine synthase (glutamine-hydrolysing)
MVTLLSGYILSAQGDRMLMAHSVEGRFPFLDSQLIDFANQLPARHKLMSMNEKHILKIACGDLVPTSISDRPKQPYRAPDAASFFFGGRLEWIRELTEPQYLDTIGIFATASVRKLLSKCLHAENTKMSNTDNMRVVAVLSTLLIHKQYIRGDGGRPSGNVPPKLTNKINLTGALE